MSNGGMADPHSDIRSDPRNLNYIEYSREGAAELSHVVTHFKKMRVAGAPEGCRFAAAGPDIDGRCASRISSKFRPCA